MEEVSFERVACLVVGLSSVTGEKVGGWNTKSAFIFIGLFIKLNPASLVDLIIILAFSGSSSATVSSASSFYTIALA